jgi:hypothetical protein
LFLEELESTRSFGLSKDLKADGSANGKPSLFGIRTGDGEMTLTFND